MFFLSVTVQQPGEACSLLVGAPRHRRSGSEVVILPLALASLAQQRGHVSQERGSFAHGPCVHVSKEQPMDTGWESGELATDRILFFFVSVPCPSLINEERSKFSTWLCYS